MAYLVAVLGAQPAVFGDERRFPTLGGHPLIPIRWAAGCGTDALYLCLDLNGVKVSYPELVSKSGLTSPGDPLDLGRLWQLARDCGAHAQAIRVTDGPDVLRRIMQDLSVRTAIVHLKEVERDGKREQEHFSAALLTRGTLRIVGENSYERDVAQEWQARWSGAALLVSAKPIVLVECRPTQLDIDRKIEPGDLIKRTIELRLQPGLAFADVKAEVRGVPGSVKRIRHVQEKGVWEVEVELTFLSWQTATTVGAVEISGIADPDAYRIKVPVCVR